MDHPEVQDDTAVAELKASIRAALEAEQPAEGGDKPNGRKFAFSPAADLVKDIGPPRWLIKDVLEAETLAVMFGDPGTMKSFLALDMACCIAAHIPWHGRFTKKGPVFIIVGEGGAGYGRRLAAWQKGFVRSLDNVPIFVSTMPAQILDKQSVSEVAEAIDDLRTIHGEPALVIIDTLARNFGPGDENSTEDMTRFISHLDSHIGNRCTRLIVHHSGITDKNRSRGNSALRAGVDAEMKVSKRDDGTIDLTCCKMKDAPEFKPIYFTPEVITIGTSDDGTPITSCVLFDAEEPEKQAEQLSPQQREALILLDLMVRKTSRTPLCAWRDLCIAEEVYTKGAFYNAVKNLEDRKIIKLSKSYVSRS